VWPGRISWTGSGCLATAQAYSSTSPTGSVRSQPFEDATTSWSSDDKKEQVWTATWLRAAVSIHQLSLPLARTPIFNHQQESKSNDDDDDDTLRAPTNFRHKCLLHKGGIGLGQMTWG